ncbi:MAG: sensor histidine kinase [Chloroflexota bacterium]
MVYTSSMTKGKKPWQNWIAELQDVKWGWLLGTAVLIQFASLLVITFIIAVYAFFLSLGAGGQPDTETIGRFAVVVGTYGGPMAQFVFTGVGAAWLVRRWGTAVYIHAILLGLTGLILGPLMARIVSGEPIPIFDIQGLLFLPLIVGVAVVGARWGQASRVSEQRLYQTSQVIGEARTAQEIVNAIGQHLVGSEVSHVALWEIVREDRQYNPTAVSLLAAWDGKATAAWTPNLELTQHEVPQFGQLSGEDVIEIKAIELPAAERAVWEQLEAKSILLVPLKGSRGDWLGLLTIVSDAVNGFSRGAERNYVTIGRQVALVLENVRLVQQTRETAVLHERQRLAREIHDTLAQGFTSIVMHLEAAEQALPNDIATTQRHLSQARQTARDSLGQARYVVEDLRPQVLERAPLHEAIQRIAADWNRQSGVQTEVVVTGDIQSLHPEVEVTLLRVTQEALSNIRQHAHATTVSITLTYLDDLVILDIQDDGVGLPTSTTSPSAKGGYGLIAMHERVQELAGSLQIESEPNEGTTIAVSLPIRE